VRLHKRAGKRSRFQGWHRACSGRRPCTVQMTQDRRVVAKFKGPLRTRLRLTAGDRMVPRGDRALLRLRAKPCKGRRHDKAKLFRGRKRITTKRLNRHCVARFRPRITHRSRFKVKVPADKRHFAGRSGTVIVRPAG
jgi:hypothetical protein